MLVWSIAFIALLAFALQADKTWAGACCRLLSHYANASGNIPNIPNSPAATLGHHCFTVFT